MLEAFHVDPSASVNPGSFLTNILTNGIDQVFAITQIDKTAANDIRRAEDSPRSPLDGQHYDKDALGRHMDAVFEHHFTHLGAGIVVHDPADMNPTDSLGRTVIVKLDHIAIITDEDMISGDATLNLRHLGIMHQHMKLTMVRNVISRMKSINQLQMIIMLGMSGDM